MVFDFVVAALISCFITVFVAALLGLGAVFLLFELSRNVCESLRDLLHEPLILLYT